MRKRKEMQLVEAAALNSVDLNKVPATVQQDLCVGAIEMAQRHRDDPGYKERFERWKAGQKKTA